VWLADQNCRQAEKYRMFELNRILAAGTEQHGLVIRLTLLLFAQF
jgi:hypothetical protein